ncbi:MAG: double zinc ribbon domain-containing protein [Burkholderiaceae bacterium]
MISRLLALTASALPSQCAVCHAWARERVCPDCVQRFTPTAPRCTGCALPLTGTATHCGTCLQHGSALDACLAAVDYAYPWDGILAKLKFASGKGVSPDPAFARTLATIMRQQPAIQLALQQADWVLPIPLSQPRLRQRGFNQALEIAKYLLQPQVGQSSCHTRLQAQLLLRTRDTPAQVGLIREQRLRNMLHAFALEPSLATQIQGARIVLVDDVTTTTATLSAAASALRAAGASQVVGMVFARTLL